MRRSDRVFPITRISLLVVALLAVVGAAAGREVDRPPEDAHTELQVRDRLLDRLGVDALTVRITARGDSIRLSGSVGERQAAELAEQLARSVAGVREVDNGLGVSTSSTRRGGGADREDELEFADARAETSVRLALVAAVGLSTLDLEVTSTDGVLTLRGEVARDDARTILATARGVSGVDKVVDLLTPVAGGGQ